MMSKNSVISWAQRHVFKLNIAVQVNAIGSMSDSTLKYESKSWVKKLVKHSLTKLIFL